MKIYETKEVSDATELKPGTVFRDEYKDFYMVIESNADITLADTDSITTGVYTEEVVSHQKGFVRLTDGYITTDAPEVRELCPYAMVVPYGVIEY